MATRYEVRQLIGTVDKKWLHAVFTTEFERVAQVSYDRYREENPGEYFELTKIESSEECLAYSPAQFSALTKKTALKQASG